MNTTYYLASLEDINIYEKYNNPASQKEVEWALVLDAVDPATGSTTQVTESFLDQRIDLQIVHGPNDLYLVTIGKGEQAISHRLYTTLEGDKPTYSFQENKEGKVALVIITDDWNMYLNGYSGEFDLEQAAIALKVTSAEGKSYLHEVQYGINALPV